jgi:nicotinamidase-related amidase
MKIGEFLGEKEPLLCRLFGGLPELRLSSRATALLLIDMQNSDAARGRGYFWRLAEERGLADEFRYYNDRLSIILPNLRSLLDTFREKQMEVIHGVSHGYTNDGRDTTRPGKIRPQTLGWLKGEETLVVDTLKPTDDEILIHKTGTGFFGITDIDRVLTNLGIENLVVGGVVTHQCVETTVRGASDHGFNVVLVEDGCATLSEELHRASLRALGDWFCKVRTTAEVLQELSRC